MPPAAVAVVGLNPLFRDLKRFGADTGPLAKAFSAAGKKAVAPIADAIRRVCPSLTGRIVGPCPAAWPAT